jgi:hypothetical protein
MNKLITLTLFIVYVFNVEGQNLSFLDTINRWNIGTHYLHEGPFQPYNYWKTSILHVKGDTVMNEKQYRKLWVCGDSLCKNESLKVYIREDSSRIFLADKTEEVLQYDFNLVKGDTMIIDLLRENSRLYFIQIDSVRYIIMQDQNTRIAQYVTVSDHYYREYSFNDIFVEGIGSLKFGIQYPSNLFITGDHYITPNLLCFYTDNSLVYNNPDFNDCYITTGIHQDQVKPELVNVFSRQHGELTLEMRSAKSGILYIYNIQGQLLKKEKIVGSINSIEINGRGIFIYKFESEDRKIQSGKIII